MRLPGIHGGSWSLTYTRVSDGRRTTVDALGERRRFLEIYELNLGLDDQDVHEKKKYILRIEYPG